MANRPKREVRKQSWTGYRLKQENGDIYTDQYFCESRHKNSLTASAHFHTKITKEHESKSSRLPQQQRTRASGRMKQALSGFLVFAGESKKISCFFLGILTW
jgi:hypothetical protein